MVFWLSAGTVVAASVGYHLSQKAIPQAANPMLSLIITFLTAIVATLLILPFFPGNTPILRELGKLNWASVAVGLTIVCVDVGYLLMYRSGWAISLGSVFSNALVALILLPVGAVIFREKLAFSNYVGVVLTLVGIYLVVRR